jgi:hypothetical protein
MSQKLVFDLLKELGGRARCKDISELAKKKYPDLSLYLYVSVRLHALSKWGYVKRNPDLTWEIVAEYA